MADSLTLIVFFSHLVDLLTMSGTTNPTDTTRATTGATTTGGAGTIPTGGSEQITIQYQTFMSNTSWPADLILDHHKSNWLEWDCHINMIADQCCFTEYLDGTSGLQSRLGPKDGCSARLWGSLGLALLGTRLVQAVFSVLGL